MNLICDTNVWYDIGAGRRDPARLKKAGHRLLATPTSFCEIASGIDGRTLPERQSAALAVVQHGDAIAEDSETHLLRQLGTQTTATVDWIQGFKDTNFGKLKRIPYPPLQDFMRKHGAI